MSHIERSYNARQERIARAHRLASEGYSREEIARDLDVALARVEDYLGSSPELAAPAVPMRFKPFDDDLEWQDQALCTQIDNEIFFPEKGGSTREAKAVCRTCPVKEPCLQYALRNDERFGIWGGASERERRRLRRTS